MKNPNFNKEAFERKVQNHIECGYSRELAERKVLGDFNGDFFGGKEFRQIGIKPNKRKTDINGNYIDS